jgi:hypothetical protein
MKYKVSNEQLEEVVKQSISYNEVLRKCGIIVHSGATWTHYKNRIKKLKLNTSHFLGKCANRGINHTGGNNKKTWKELLVKRNTRNRPHSSRLRRAYTEYCKEFNIPYNCSKCKNEGKWMEKSLKLEISHIDDDRSNDNPNNLEWLCPNCHSIKS